jgi:N,N'-diacetyllegionaminate synthase
MRLSIGKSPIGEGHRTYLIAEAGVNHNGQLSLAKSLIDAALDSGADAVKFQTYRTEFLVTRGASTAPYQRRSGLGKTQFAMLKELELTFKQFEQLNSYCVKRKITFLSTPFDLESVRFLAGLGIPAFKIGSGDLDNFALLGACAELQKPLLLSTGMSTLSDVRSAVSYVQRKGVRQMALFQCTSAYPTPPENVNLRVMETLRNTFHVPVGFSDHTPGVAIAWAAVARGAALLEKHLTISKHLAGPDHCASLEPKEFRSLSEGIRAIESSLGAPVKKVLDCEYGNRAVARRSLVTRTCVLKGEKLTEENVIALRPGGGLSASHFPNVIGRRAARRLREGHRLEMGDLVKESGGGRGWRKK